MTLRYFLRDGAEVDLDGYIAALLTHALDDADEMSLRRVELDTVAGIEVSTVWTGTAQDRDGQLYKGPFETRIVGGQAVYDTDETFRFWHTEAEAHAGHAVILAEINASLRPHEN